MEELGEVGEKGYARGVLPKWQFTDCPGEFCMTCGGMGFYMARELRNTRDVLISETTTETVTKTVHRQVTIDGKKVDLRNARNAMILIPPIENLIDLAEVWPHQLETEKDQKVRRAIEMSLQRLIGYRGSELPPDFKQIILLTLKGELSYTSTKWVNLSHSPTSTPFAAPKPPPKQDGDNII